MSQPDDATVISVSEAMLDRVREIGSGSSDFVDQILDTPGLGGIYGGIDGRAGFLAILGSLVTLCGSEEAAADWLFDAPAYAAITGSEPCLMLENGNFWSLMVMQDWLQILVRHKQSCTELIDEIFTPTSR
ncbi:hypothetical protein [Novosphingobium sp.]|uniref:hypothetical protein n=1 Tax=Novosphingobium sp. TaxID=1874826 RepID=UPI0028B028F5|nr:hypothetical protein [Novosphingobium sp.]